MTLQRYSHTGAAPATGLASPISSSDTSLSLVSGTGYPTGASGLFVIVLDPGTASEEKVLCSSLSTNTITVQSGGRGYDGTVAASHQSGTTNVEHVWTGAEADDASRHIYGVLPGPTLSDDHTNYYLASGARTLSGNMTVSGVGTGTPPLITTSVTGHEMGSAGPNSIISANGPGLFEVSGYIYCNASVTVTLYAAFTDHSGQAVNQYFGTALQGSLTVVDGLVTGAAQDMSLLTMGCDVGSGHSVAIYGTCASYTEVLFSLWIKQLTNA